MFSYNGSATSSKITELFYEMTIVTKGIKE